MMLGRGLPGGPDQRSVTEISQETITGTPVPATDRARRFPFSICRQIEAPSIVEDVGERALTEGTTEGAMRHENLRVGGTFTLGSYRRFDILTMIKDSSARAAAETQAHLRIACTKRFRGAGGSIESVPTPFDKWLDELKQPHREAAYGVELVATNAAPGSMLHAVVLVVNQFRWNDLPASIFMAKTISVLSMADIRNNKTPKGDTLFTFRANGRNEEARWSDTERSEDGKEGH